MKKLWNSDEIALYDSEAGTIYLSNGPIEKPFTSKIGIFIEEIPELTEVLQNILKEYKAS